MQETTPQVNPNHTDREILHYPKATAKSRPYVFDMGFMKQEPIPEFRKGKVPDIYSAADYNDDLCLFSFRKSNYIWAGPKSRGHYRR